MTDNVIVLHVYHEELVQEGYLIIHYLLNYLGIAVAFLTPGSGVCLDLMHLLVGGLIRRGFKIVQGDLYWSCLPISARDSVILDVFRGTG